MSVETLRRQLDIEKSLFGYQYHADAALDAAFTDQLAQYLAGQGLGDIRELSFTRQPISGTVFRRVCYSRGDSDECVNEPVSVTQPGGWFVNNRSGAKLARAMTDVSVICEPGPDPNTVNMDWRDCPAVPGEGDAIPLWVVNGPDRWVCTFYVAFTPDGVAYFLPLSRRQSSSWTDFREALVFFFTVASFAVPGIGAVIGQAVFGAQLAAAYPALVSVATNTIIQTTLSGGDVESAVTRAVAAYAGGLAGGLVGSGVDSAVIGRLSGAATTAALTGGDIKSAVAVALLQAGATMQPSVPDQPAKGGPMDYGDFNSDTGGTVVTPGGEFDYVFAVGEGTDFGSINFDAPFSDAPIDLSGDPMFGGGGYDVPANVPPPSPSDGGSWNDALKMISTTALTALQVYKAYQSAGSPAPKSGLPAQTVRSDGTISTRNPNGTTSVSKPAPGQPYVMADGTLVLNNGDGTYTLIASDGTRTTRAYPTPSSGGALALPGVSGQQWALIAAVGLGALFLMSRKRRA